MSLARATANAKKALLVFAVTALVTGGAHFGRAQSALDGFDPNANGTIRIVVVQPDGKILLGGDFTTLSPNGGAPVTRNRIARLNPDGTLDTAFDPNANGSVYAIAVQADGKILLGGTFNGANSIGGQARNFIARLDATTGLADSFNPNATSDVYSISIQADGRILIGGAFFAIGGTGGVIRNFIARLDPTTGAADSFNPNASGFVWTIAVQVNGKIIVGGQFHGPQNSIGGQVRNGIARLDPATGLADSWDPNANSDVYSIAVQSDGKILAGGFFITIGGQPRSKIARLDATTGAADSFDPNADSDVRAIVIQTDGKILAGGFFTNIGGQSRGRIARLDATTGLADSFNPNANNTVLAIAVQADGKILAGGGFTTLGPNGGAAVARNNIARLEIDGRLDQTLSFNAGYGVQATAVQVDGKILIGGQFYTGIGVNFTGIERLNTDGTLDTAFNPDVNSTVLSISTQVDGKILLAGFFTTVAGQTRNRIARLNADGTLDSVFNPNANDVVYSIAVQADGKILANGLFTNVGGQARNRIARLDATTGSADSFDPNANDGVYTITIQADGKILVGGYFTSIGGQTRNCIARLDAITGLADSFNPNANSVVSAIVVRADGKILAGGNFSSIGGQTRNWIARLDSTTGLADSFNPHSNSNVVSIAMQADGKILVGGSFSTIGGQPRSKIARLAATTGLADSFDPNATGNNVVLSIATLTDGKVVAAGEFTNAGGQAREGFARLTNDIAALQNLAVTRTSVTWIRGGSSALFTRVTFEYSDDNVTYTPLGNGTLAGSNWTLTGLNFATGQNFHVRARGYQRSSYFNGSESITESVRNAYISPPPTPTQVVSRKIHGGAGTFDISLPLTGDPGIECRSGGASNNYQVVLTFPSAVTFTNAAISMGAGSVSGSSGSGTSAVTVNLTGVTNAQRITVTLSNVDNGTSTGNVGVQMGVLIGDVSGNGTVSSTDVSQTKVQSGQVVTNGNFRADVNVNGSISAADVSQVKSQSGNGLP